MNDEDFLPYSPDLEGDDFLDWLNDAATDDPILKNLTSKQIKITFRSEGHNLLRPTPKAFVGPSMSSRGHSTDVSSANRLYRCKIAQMNSAGNLLSLPGNEKWVIGDRQQSSIYVRDAYKDHWKIIKNHFIAEKSIERLIISGSPGVGKSVEGIFLVHQIFEHFAHSPPPILYADCSITGSSLAFIHGYVFTVPNHMAFEDTLSYKIMAANGPVWHIYDSTCPGVKEGSTFGPQIIISSPGRANEEDMKAIKKRRHLMIYLPLPNLQEMQEIRSHLFDDISDVAHYLPEDKMIEVIDKFGCVPRIVFDFGKRKIELNNILDKLENAIDVERLLAMVGGAVIDHDVASGNFVHVVPYHRLSDIEAGENESAPDNYDEYAFPPHETQKRVTVVAKKKGNASEAGIAAVGVSEGQTMELLKAQYTVIAYTWASDYIRDVAFQTFLGLSADRMMMLILRAQGTHLAGFRGLLLEPFVHKLLSETGVVGRMRNLETDKELGIKRFGPWKPKYVFKDHADLQSKRDQKVYCVPHRGNEPAIDSLVPGENLCFQVTTSTDHGINRPGLVTLVSSGIFDDLGKKGKGKNKGNLKFIWVVERGMYAELKKQDFHDVKKKVYAKNSPLRTYFHGLEQFAFEVDMRRIYEFQHAQQTKKAVDMTNISKVEEFRKAVKKIMA